MDLRLPRVRGLLGGRGGCSPPRPPSSCGRAGTWTAVAGDDPAQVRRADQVMAVGDGVRLDTSYFTAGPGGRRPAVLLAHGFGGSKDDVREQAEDLARAGTRS
ncbi:alpha/beta fold hydrolase [Streptomyces violaceorubidus]